jgi:hypothetical protein
VGEFGVEILRWQGLARTLAHSRPWREIIAAAHPSRLFLYEDFCDRLVPYRPASEHALGFDCRGNVDEAIHRHFIKVDEGDVLFTPQVPNVQRRLIYGMSASRSTYRNFAIGAPEPALPFDLLIHARATLKAGQGHKNWPVRRWSELIAALPPEWRIASIGSKEGAHKIAGTVDLRDIPLAALAGHCAKARLVLGPSSGAIHYAIHCGAPVVTWIDRDEGDAKTKEDSRCNYFPQWNPWEVPFCCLRGWQPSTELVVRKIDDLLALIGSTADPIDWLVIGTKRSGHHGFIEWMVGLDPSTRYRHWNDCVSRGMETFPRTDFVLPTRRTMPKALHLETPMPTVFEWNTGGSRSSRILSFEGPPIEKIASLPEAQSAKRLVFVLRDAPNFLASIKRGIPEFGRQPFLAPDFRDTLEIYRGYLLEALGRTSHLGALREKTVFVSYNRWHMDADYRTEVAIRLGGQGDPGRGMAASYIHASGFQPFPTPAEQLDSLARWDSYRKNEGFWNLTSDPELGEAERVFHGPYCVMSLDIPTKVHEELVELPVWALGSSSPAN